MKIILGFLCIVICLCGCTKKSSTAPSDRITISGAWALYPMVIIWAEEYRKLNPDLIIDISAGGTCKGMTDALTGVADLGMVSRSINKSEADRGAWWVGVAKDGVIPMINSNNPLRNDLIKRGLTQKEFADIWRNGKAASWNAFVTHDTSFPIRAYTRSDPCGASETWAKYVGGTQEDLKGIGVYGDPGLADAVRNDTCGIGYNNVHFAYDAGTKKPVRGIEPIPVDVNGNGKIDPEENFYADRDALVKAIAEGNYPSPPGRNLYLVSRGVPKKKRVAQFIIWILNDGQKYVSSAGYICLPKEELQKQSELLVKAEAGHK